MVPGGEYHINGDLIRISTPFFSRQYDSLARTSNGAVDIIEESLAPQIWKELSLPEKVVVLRKFNMDHMVE